MKSQAGSILIVDDVPDSLRLLSRMLTHKGYEIRSALNGVFALKTAQAAPPDLILLDINMPQMDGYEVCQQLKADARTREIPIIFISALNDSTDRVKAFQVGGADYIAKPFSMEEVSVRVENQLRLCRLQAQLSSQSVRLQQQINERDRALRAGKVFLEVRQQIQLQLQKLNEELARSNQELEHFAHGVAHDLQQPLQSISGFARLLSVKYSDSLDETAQQYLACIANSGNHLQHLIQDLLAYAQVGQQAQSFAPVDCNQVLAQVKTNLNAAIAERAVLLTHAELPEVVGSEPQLVQLFQNLISNAIKFTHPEVSPHIRISATLQGDWWLFGVHDNGIGIPSQAMERVFQAFQRLHSARQYPGNGIGLATCKKIVDHHQGKIWVESQLNAGSSFYFTLPHLNTLATGLANPAALTEESDELKKPAPLDQDRQRHKLLPTHLEALRLKRHLGSSLVDTSG